MKTFLSLISIATLVACLQPQDDRGPRMGEPNLIIMQVTGDDGAAFGEIGEAVLRPNGDLWCILRYEGGGDAGRFTVPGAYEEIAELIQRNVSPNGPSNGDILRLNAANDPTGYIDVRPHASFDGLSSPLGRRVSSILNAATNGQCWRWG